MHLFHAALPRALRLLTWPLPPRAQEFEHRFRVWLDNLEYILDYNSKHTSHWVSTCCGSWSGALACAQLAANQLIKSAPRPCAPSSASTRWPI